MVDTERHGGRPHQAELHDLPAEHGIEQPIARDPHAIGRQRREVVAASHQLGQQAGYRHAERAGRSLGPTQVDDEAQIAMPVGPAPSATERRGDVARREPPLPHRVLGGHRGEFAPPGQVRNRGYVAAGKDVRVARHGQVLVDHQPAPGCRQAELLDHRIGTHPDAPDQRPGGHERPV